MKKGFKKSMRKFIKEGRLAKQKKEKEERVNEQNLNQESISIISKSQDIIIFSKEDNEYANSVLKMVKTLQKQIKAFWKDPIDKANQTHKALTQRRFDMIHPTEIAEVRIKDKISIYLTGLRKKEEEAEKTLQKKAIDEGITVPVTIKKEEKPAGQGARKSYYAEVLDENAIPRKYLMVNMAMLNGIAKIEGLKSSVPGVIFKEKLIISTRI